jgi:HlyD family secretion protein
LAIAAVIAWALWPKPIAVETAVIDRRPIEVSIEDEGKTRIREVFTVSAPIAGKLLRLNLHAGDAVSENQTVVALIKPAEPGLLDVRAKKIAEAVVEARQAAVDLATAQAHQADAQLGFLDAELARATTLVSRGTISERAFEKATLDVALAKAEVESVKANLLVRQRELESARAALIEGEAAAGSGRCCVEVRAPASGEVLRVLTESEQVVQAGTPLIEIGDPTNLEIVVDLLSRDAVRAVPGAEATIEGWGGPPLKATVTRIEPAAVTKVSALGIEEQRVTVELKLLDPPERWPRLGHGFRVIVRILLWRGENLVAVPMGALFRQGSAWAVFIVKDGVARLQPVELGERNTDYAEVAAGLDPGMAVILHPGDSVTDGSRLAVSR